MKIKVYLMTQTMLYIVFALIATIVNLFTQEVTSRLFHNQHEIEISIFVGTLAGLVAKYLLDKKYIFKFKATSQKKDITTFLFYSLMGIVTTCLFWTTEYAFDMWFETKTMRYTGAIIGLSLGYTIKYHLDKKYVFIER